MGAPGLGTWGLRGDFQQDLGAGQGGGTAASREEHGEPNSSKSGKALVSRAQGKLASASNFLAVPDFVTGKGAGEERPSAVCPARQARLLPPRHPPTEPGLLGAAGAGAGKNFMEVLCLW